MHATEATSTPPTTSGGQGRRVREEVKDGLAVIAFSAAASSALAIVMVVLTMLAS